jgi:hypothetical protein
MVHINKVMTSTNDDTGFRCVDIFLRPDGTFGFEEYRRDPEDGRGWRSATGFGERSFLSVELAASAAKQSVGWLSKTG